MTIDVVIVTYKREGIERVSKMFLPKKEGVKYLVSWQKYDDFPVPDNLIRDDIEIIKCHGKGISKNRNNGISHSQADLIYLCDDDILLMPEIFDIILERFKEYPETQLATFKMKEEGRKKYPDNVVRLQFYLPKNYNIGSYQMAFKREIYHEVKFNELFGLNSELFTIGEDEIFHLCARKKGLVCMFFPDVIASHPHEASGRKTIKDPKAIEGLGAVITKSFPKSFFPRLFLKAYRMRKTGQNTHFVKTLFHLCLGSIKSFRIKL